jgi:hypothetical protein
VTTFTGRKLDLLRAVRFDRTVGDYAYRVMSIIVDHLNEKTERTQLSDDRIAFETGSGWPRRVVRARRNLRDTNWLIWRRTRTANVYSVNFAKAAVILSVLERERNARRQRPTNIEKRNETQIEPERRISTDRTFCADPDRTPASDIHLRGNTSKQEGSRGRKNLEVFSLENGKAQDAERRGEKESKDGKGEENTRNFSRTTKRIVTTKLC